MYKEYTGLMRKKKFKASKLREIGQEKVTSSKRKVIKEAFQNLSTSGQKYTSTGKLPLDKAQEERKFSLFCFVSIAAIFCRKEKKNPKRPAETIPPFYLRLHKT